MYEEIQNAPPPIEICEYLPKEFSFPKQGTLFIGEDGAIVHPHIGRPTVFPEERLEWDEESIKFTNNDEANSYLHTEYRNGWEMASL